MKTSNTDISARSNEQYLSMFVSPVIDQLISDILITKPSNVVAFACKWFQQLDANADKFEDQQQDIEKIKITTTRRRRGAVLETRYHENIVLSDTAPKTEYAKSKLLFTCAQLFLFKSFAPSEMDNQLQQEELLFSEGDQIDGLYIVINGQLIGTNRNGEKRHYSSDSIIGQLSLLYFQQSSQTIIATKNTTLYKFPKQIYSTIIQTIRKSNQYNKQKIIDESIFKNMSNMQKSQLASIMQQQMLYENSELCKSLDEQFRIILVQNGRIQLLKKGGNNENIKTYLSGDHIQQDIVDYKTMILVAKTDSKLSIIKKSAFSRMFGSYQRFVQRQKAIKKAKKIKYQQ